MVAFQMATNHWTGQQLGDGLNSWPWVAGAKI